jgi:hypothetical protein
MTYRLPKFPAAMDLPDVRPARANAFSLADRFPALPPPDDDGAPIPPTTDATPEEGGKSAPDAPPPPLPPIAVTVVVVVVVDVVAAATVVPLPSIWLTNALNAGLTLDL